MPTAHGTAFPAPSLPLPHPHPLLALAALDSWPPLAVPYPGNTLPADTGLTPSPPQAFRFSGCRPPLPLPQLQISLPSSLSTVAPIGTSSPKGKGFSVFSLDSPSA